MTVLVDEARWPWRGQRWAHLCSDASLDELHAFARSLGVRRVSFQGDHYDVDAAKRAEAVAAGAVPLDARELVRRVRSAGLLARTVRAEYRWRTVAAVEAGPGGVGEAGRRVAGELAGLLGPAQRARLASAIDTTLARVAANADGRGAVGVRALARPGEVAVVISAPAGAGGPAVLSPAGLDRLVDEVHHTVDRGAAVTELFVRPG